MTLKPTNRYLLVESNVEKEDPDRVMNILLPKDYKAKKEEYIVVKVRDWAEDCKLSCYFGAQALVHEKMIENIVVGDETYNLILENYVVGFLSES